VRSVACVLLLMFPLPAAAQDGTVAATQVRACLGGAASREEALGCRGSYAAGCSASAPGGESTAGMAACAAAEGEGWEIVLNEVYADLVLLARRQDLRDAEDGVASADLRGMLRDAQRAWIAFRDSDCAHEAAIWGEGSQRQVAAAFCLLDRTATRVVGLRVKQEQMRMRLD
jgi:uncharacterized protein YecT (DUF1311 family)